MSQSLYRDDEGSRGEFLKLLIEQGEEPSFLRRSRAVHEAWEELLRKCASHRHALLRGPRMRLANLAHRLDEGWSRLHTLLDDERQVSVFSGLYEDWKAQLPSVVNSGPPWATIRSSLKEFSDSVHRFNRDWAKHLQGVDLGEVNRLRADYNRYYPLEKAAAFDCEDIARLGFAPLELATLEQLAAQFPPLAAPVLRSRKRRDG